MYKLVMKAIIVLLPIYTFGQNGYIAAFGKDINTTEAVSSQPPGVNGNKKTNRNLFAIISPQSVWVGATLAYNFLDKGTENIVGAAKVTIAPVKQFENNKHFKVFVVGNLSKITSSLSKEDPIKDVNEIMQSSQGMSIGVSPVYTINPDNKNENIFRAYGSANFKVNGFQDVGQDEETVNITQFRGTLGIEFEGWAISDGGPFNLSTEFIFSAFDKKDYAKVFNEGAKSAVGMETTFIIPIGHNFGFLASWTVSDKTSSVFQTGVIVKTSKK
jgi:hypothetical protein